MWRRVAICFSFGILCLVQGWALPSTTPAQGRIDSSGGRATGLPDIPEACKTPRMRPEAPAEVPRNEVESQGLSAEAYESLGTFYGREGDRKSTRLNSSHGYISYAVFCLKKKKTAQTNLMCASLY